MATTMTKKQRHDEIIEVLEQYLSQVGPRVEQILAESHARSQEEASLGRCSPERARFSIASWAPGGL
jgi:hypothetical protein